MKNKDKDLIEYFKLKPVKAAKVSEISETTASSAAVSDERVNFHIGNPVQDERLASLYLKIILNLDLNRKSIDEENEIELLSELGWEEKDKSYLQFLKDLIVKSSPYLPRGGFLIHDPHFLIKYFSEWLVDYEQEPLYYDLGETSGKREIILASGGIYEALRIFLHALANYMIYDQANIFLLNFPLPEYSTSYNSLHFFELPENEEDAIQKLKELLPKEKEKPSFIFLGSILSEVARRSLRQLSLTYPLFFVEVNNAPNHLSLAREAKMMNSVLRFLTPAIFSPILSELSIVFIAGNSDFIKVIETVHFQLKGTPSASEVEFLSYILKEKLYEKEDDVNNQKIEIEPAFENFPFNLQGQKSIGYYSNHFENKLSEILQDRLNSFEKKIDKFTLKGQILNDVIPGIKWFNSYDGFESLDAKSLFEEFINNLDSANWYSELAKSFLQAFLRHHPEYEVNSCIVVSGSSRTALGLLGFYCGIKEVIITDLSWTYEHCFPDVTAIPLTKKYDLDVDAIINVVKNKLKDDPNWKKKGAIAINNPHNATGQIFDQTELERLIIWLLGNDIFIIDDLAYQNVVPDPSLIEIKTIRQITQYLIKQGYVSKDKERYVITVHSLSKTDSLAGARLSVVEIRDKELYQKFYKLNSQIKPNSAAIFLTYLFYRNYVENINAYYRLRNAIFAERMKALEEAVKNLPPERNSFNIVIIPAKGSMYPRMVINKLPAGLSLDWLASGLARQGIGLIPLSTFARTEQGFEIARKSFRLTLGGVDNEDKLLVKTRRVLIDLNRMIAEEASNYNRKEFELKINNFNKGSNHLEEYLKWDGIEKKIRNLFNISIQKRSGHYKHQLQDSNYLLKFSSEYLSERLGLFRHKFSDRLNITLEISNIAKYDKGKQIIQKLEKEFYKDSLERREEAFRKRLYDRTVHPTQMYSIKTEIVFDNLIDKLIKGYEVSDQSIEKIAQELISEFLGFNVAINSNEEADEILLDLSSLIAAEDFSDMNSDNPIVTFLSFWGDWDGSNRPSGQGHHLVSSVLIRNVDIQSRLLKLLIKSDRSIKIDPDILNEIEKLPGKNAKFARLLNDISILTHQLEKKYRGILPFNIKPKKVRQIGMKLHIAKDPLTSLWQHNDRLERKMLELRNQRKYMLQYYFSTNKKFRKALHSLLPSIQKNLDKKELIYEFGLYKDLMKRFIITPRIHQNIITAQDQFAVDTTAHNINEINEISGRYGNPGMILGLQVSMSTKPEALILLDRKMRAKKEEYLRENSEIEIPSVWLIPLFEDTGSVKNIRNYLNKIWEYSLQSRRMNQETGDRFSEIINEIFIAGSDLSQQVSQASAMALYKETKFEFITWLSERSLVNKVRIKFGSGETMQRQGGYYFSLSGNPAFIQSNNSRARFSKYLKESTKKSTEYAVTPLMGVFAGGDLRTFQSNISEKLRYLSVDKLSQLLYHINVSQKFLQNELVRASDPLRETRLQFKTRGLQELERLTLGKKDKIFEEFLKLLTDNFRQILYGREEDVVGIHIISYFIAKTTPPLRDRPTVRPGKEVSGIMGTKILERIAETIPFAHYGSLLRAIAHNQAQTMVLGINQLTTGLFLTLNSFTKKQFPEGDTITLLTDRILPNLPIYDILHTLRIYHDSDLFYLNKMEKAFPAGNSTFIALREDIDSMNKYLIFFQKELLRRHGLNITDFFDEDGFITDLLPTVRTDLAVLLQPNIFNTNLEEFLSSINGKVEEEWTKEIDNLLKIPETIKFYRSKIWELLEEPIFQRVSSFVELAISLYSLSTTIEKKEINFSPNKLKLSPDIKSYFSVSSDDNMHQFLAAAFEYLSSLSESSIEVPINIIRALKDVEKIFKIEEQALSIKDQDLLRFNLLQIARIAGENG